MKKPKSYNKILDIDENFNFVEEIPDNEVKEYHFDDPKEDKKNNLIIIIISLLSIILFFGGLYYAFIRPRLNRGGVTNTQSDLYGIFPTVEFGETIDSFLEHYSFQTASTYEFRVENRNSEAIEYKLQIIEQEQHLKEKIDKDELNFMLIKNNSMLNDGDMSSIKSYIAETTISGKSVDNYQLKLWSDSPVDRYFSYRVEIVE